MEAQTYVHRPNRFKSILALLLFGASAAFFVHLMAEGRGVVINGIIELDSDGARWFYGTLLAASCGLVIMGLIALLSPARQVAVDEDALELPTGLFGRHQRRVTWGEILRITELRYAGARVLTLWLREGKVALSDSTVGGYAYDELHRVIAAKLASNPAPC